jgi:serine/threonine-protein kinase HipA
MARIRKLDIWLDGFGHVAQLESRHWNELRCRYDKATLKRWPQNAPILSCSLPLREGRADARAFCRGLLPEGKALDALAADAGVAVTNTFDLLRRYGRDVAGALVIAEDDSRQRDRPPPTYELYEPEELAQAVANLDESPLDIRADSELSVAGLQDKLLLVRDADGWARPRYGYPSTHILKAEDPRFEGLIEYEAQCLALACALGLAEQEAELAVIAGRSCLIAPRFDRTRDGEEVRRIHQEDLCQAMGIDPSDMRGRAKYEADGGPGFRDLAHLLDAHADDGVAQLERLAAAMTFTVLIGNADAHGKNLSILYREPSKAELAPLYDTVPTRLWPQLRSDAAMAVSGKRDLDAIGFDDLRREATSWGLSSRLAETAVIGLAERARELMREKTLPRSSPVAKYVLRQAERILAAKR